MQSFFDKVAVVTGAGSGMGRALAQRLAAEGCHLALADVRAESLEETVRLAKDAATAAGHRIRCAGAVVDVADADAVRQFADQTVRAQGAVHLLFNNAGVSVTGPFEQVSLEDVHWLMGINFWGVVHGCRSFLPYLRQAGEAHIVNTSSVFGLVSVPGQSAYHAAKFAVKGFTDALRLELADSRVRVSCVMPGGVKTGIVKSSRYLPGNNLAPTREELAQQFERLAGLTPLAAADEILRGVKSGKAHILVGRDAKALALLVRLLPVRYYPVLEWFARRQTGALQAGRPGGADGP